MLLTNWSDQNGLTLNTNKCNVISFYKGNNPLLFDYFINSDKLNRVSVIKDLVVLFDSSVTFESDINYIVSKSFKLLGTADFTDTATIIHVYKSLFLGTY